MRIVLDGVRSAILSASLRHWDAMRETCIFVNLFRLRWLADGVDDLFILAVRVPVPAEVCAWRDEMPQ